MSEAASAPEPSAPVHLSGEERLVAKADAYFAANEPEAPAEPADEPVSFNEALDEPEDEPEVDDAPDTDEPAEESEAEELESEPGSEKDPWTLKDLPDEYVTVKIDGEEQTLPLRQLAENGMRQQTFDKRAHELKQLTERAETMLAESQENAHKLRAGITATLSSHERLLPYLNEHYPDVLDELALQHYPTLHRAHEEGDLKSFMAQRKVAQKERSLRAEEARLEQQRREAESARGIEAKRALVLPALKAAALAAKAEITKEARADIGAALNARATALGRDLTGDEIQDIATRFLRTYAETGEAPKARKPRRKTKRRAAQGERRAAPSGRGQEPPKRGPDGRLNEDWLIWRQGH